MISPIGYERVGRVLRYLSNRPGNQPLFGRRSRLRSHDVDAAAGDIWILLWNHLARTEHGCSLRAQRLLTSHFMQPTCYAHDANGIVCALLAQSLSEKDQTKEA